MGRAPRQRQETQHAPLVGQASMHPLAVAVAHLAPQECSRPFAAKNVHNANQGRFQLRRAIRVTHASAAQWLSLGVQIAAFVRPGRVHQRGVTNVISARLANSPRSKARVALHVSVANMRPKAVQSVRNASLAGSLRTAKVHAKFVGRASSQNLVTLNVHSVTVALLQPKAVTSVRSATVGRFPQIPRILVKSATWASMQFLDMPAARIVLMGLMQPKQVPSVPTARKAAFPIRTKVSVNSASLGSMQKQVSDFAKIVPGTRFHRTTPAVVSHAPVAKLLRTC